MGGCKGDFKGGFKGDFKAGPIGSYGASGGVKGGFKGGLKGDFAGQGGGFKGGFQGQGAPCMAGKGVGPVGSGVRPKGPNPYANIKHGKKLFVGGIGPELDTGAMKAYFLKFGDISDCVVMKDGGGRNRGFGFVQFRKKEDAMKCMQAWGTHMLGGRYVEVKPIDVDEQRQKERDAKAAQGSSPSQPRRSRSTPSPMRRRNEKVARSSPSVKRPDRGARSSPSVNRPIKAARSSPSVNRPVKAAKRSPSVKRKGKSPSRKERAVSISSGSRKRGGGRSKSHGNKKRTRNRSGSGPRRRKLSKCGKRSGSSSSSSSRSRRKRSRSKGGRPKDAGAAAPAPIVVGADREESEEEIEVDIVTERAEMRRQQAGSMSNLDELPVVREPRDLPEPIDSWQDACDRGYLDQALVGKLQAAGLDRPTLIQRHALPVISHKNGHYDLIASAQTGSGKTFAFVIPTVARLILQGAIGRPFFAGPHAQGSPLLLLLSPTRELAVQTSKEVEVMTSGTQLVTNCCYGGESTKAQIDKIIRAQTDVLCATPGRLCDLVDVGKLSLSFVQSCVLDEADQMLDLGLEQQVEQVFYGRDMPQPSHGRQTLLFSATMPQKIRDMTPKILRKDAIANLAIGKYGGDQGGSCSSIKQIVKLVEEHQKTQALLSDLQVLWLQSGTAATNRGKVVIFTNRRVQANTLASAIARHGIKCGHLHGKLEQHEREEVVQNFRRGACEVLVATNVASRGLDFPDISLVVQYDMPPSMDTYTHRIGRTGRVGQVGCALAYCGRKDLHLAKKLADFLMLNGQMVPDFLRDHAPREYLPGKPGFAGGHWAQAQQLLPSQQRLDSRAGGGLLFKNHLQEAASHASAALSAGTAGPAGGQAWGQFAATPGAGACAAAAWRQGGPTSPAATSAPAPRVVAPPGRARQSAQPESTWL